MGLFMKAAVVAVVAVLLVQFFPIMLDFDPVYYDIPLPSFEGPYAPNDLLSKAERVHEDVLLAPEALIVGPDGHIYTGLINGYIVRLVGKDVQKVVRTGPKDCAKEPGKPHECGRPLGLRFGKDGLLYVADAFFGLLSVDVSKGKVTTLVPRLTEVGGKNITFPDDLDIDKDGIIYFSDASTKWNYYQFPFSAAERQTDGRVLKYSPKTRKLEVVVDNMSFPNGVQLDKDENSLLIAECNLRRIIRYYLKGPKAGQREVVLDQLPGNPDNIRPSSSGGYWVALAAARNKTHKLTLDVLAEYPALLRFYVRAQYLIGTAAKFVGDLISCHCLQDFAFAAQNGMLVSIHSSTSMVLEISKDGKVLRNLQAPFEQCGHISNVLDHKGTLYLGSFASNYLTILKQN